MQTPYYWPSQVPTMDSIDYAVYLAKRTLRNKQKHALDDYEIEAFNELRKNMSQKWDFITMQADEQVRLIHFLKFQYYFQSIRELIYVCPLR